jgi:gentisate 1,2-dioxygenase
MLTERERQRTRLVDPYYEDLIAEYRAKHLRTVEGKVVIDGAAEPWVQNRNAYVQYLLHPFKSDSAYPLMHVFINEIHTHNGVHRHQGGLVLYVLEGKGRTVYDGVEAEWEAGDLILLPIKPGGVEHQHFNDDPRRPARWLAFITLAFRDYLASELIQVKDSPDWVGEAREDAPTAISDLRAGVHQDVRAAGGHANDGTYLDRLFEMRDAYRARVATAETHIHGSRLPWEINRQGKMKWYMHPARDDVALRSLIVFRQEIAPSSRSGRQLHPGGLVHYVLRGGGYTILDGQRHDWRAGDLIALPVRAHGIDYQHFNVDPREPVEFIVATPNLVEVLGMDLGARFEQLENAPEYRSI